MFEVIKEVVGVAFLVAIIVVPVVDHHKRRKGFSNWIYLS